MARNTHTIIMNEFSSMLEEMLFDKITVSELVRRCNISPNTFYYHYKDIYELLADWFSDGFKRYQNNNPQTDWKTIVKDLLMECRRHPSVVYHIYNSLSREALERFVFMSSSNIVLIMLKEKDKIGIPENRLNQIADMFKYSLLGFFLHFVWNKMEDDIDSSLDALSRMVSVMLSDASGNMENQQ